MESLNKQTYANNANITTICQNSTVCKEYKSINTSLTPKVMRENANYNKFIRSQYAKDSTLYHSLSLLVSFCNSGKLSVFQTATCILAK